MKPREPSLARSRFMITGGFVALKAEQSKIAGIVESGR